ncbi:hypothetical protein V6356_18345 [Acinetobacter baumannii]|uniref:hypothetical protein n=1 Tax=Acinetobacter baumannii TaxID=470 RepID=UPI000E7172F1|nr:hypothetical protein [Acinetobacter baumannii]MDY7408218.1 hypothetical protein [Acinetobacter baumannii]RJO04647.1 hypothetical protein D3X56_00200 [Acinetobacter baumannii]HCU1906157.1 hypothetical protein [Acinetobacter baumannii]
MERRKRIALSVDPELHELLNGIAHYQKKTTTAVITDILKQHKDILEAMLKAYQDYEKGLPIDVVVQALWDNGLLATDTKPEK